MRISNLRRSYTWITKLSNYLKLRISALRQPTPLTRFTPFCHGRYYTNTFLTRFSALTLTSKKPTANSRLKVRGIFITSSTGWMRLLKTQKARIISYWRRTTRWLMTNQPSVRQLLAGLTNSCCLRTTMMSWPFLSNSSKPWLTWLLNPATLSTWKPF